jgi:hypothetical protein
MLTYLNPLGELVAKPLLARNTRFKDIHDGQTCYIIGEGASLKYFDFRFFSDHPSIGINHFYLHKDISKINIKYAVIPEPYFFYPFIHNCYSNTYIRNNLGKLCKSEIKRLKHIDWFTSLSNIFAGLPSENTFYLHHFGQRELDPDYRNIDGVFSYMKGGLYTALGLAAFMGFTKAKLIGCDYVFRPSELGYFWAKPAVKHENKQMREAKGSYENIYENLFSSFINRIEISTISSSFQKAWIPSIDYASYTGADPIYREYDEIVSTQHLNTMKLAYKTGQVISEM